MRKLMLLDNATLDGYLARRSDPNAATLVPIVEEQFNWQADLLAGYDTLLIGRGSYLPAAQFWPHQPGRLGKKLTSMTKVVFSSTPIALDWENSHYATDAPAAELDRLRRVPGAGICVKGSPTLARALSRDRLINEYVLILHPLIAGPHGDPIPHFHEPADLPPLRLAEVRELPGDAVALTYTPR